MQSRCTLSADPSADRISDRLEAGSAETSRSARPCSRVSWRRAEESIRWPDCSAATSSGWLEWGSSSPTTSPWRRTTIRSAIRNICSGSWLTSSTVVPRSRKPRDQLLHIRGLGRAQRRRRLVEHQQPRPARQRPRDGDQMALTVGQLADQPGRVPDRESAGPRSTSAAAIWKRRSDEHQPPRLRAEQHVAGDVEVVAQARGPARRRRPHADGRRPDRPGACGRRRRSARMSAQDRRRRSARASSCRRRARRRAPPAHRCAGSVSTSCSTWCPPSSMDSPDVCSITPSGAAATPSAAVHATVLAPKCSVRCDVLFDALPRPDDTRSALAGSRGGTRSSRSGQSHRRLISR